MKGTEMRDAIRRQRSGDKHFIRWWRKENDFVDYELLDKFLGRLDDSLEFSGFELLDLNQMWQTLQRWVGNKVHLERRTRGKVLVWSRGEGETNTVEELPFNAESVMHIFDQETRGNTLQ